MRYWAAVFLVLAGAAVFVSAVAPLGAALLAKVAFVVFVLLAVVSLALAP